MKMSSLNSSNPFSGTFEDNLSNTNSKSDQFGNRNIPGSSNSDNNMDDMLGSASDYILIAMIVAMMFCMTICCLCLFCRSSSRFSICGFNFEMNNPTTPVVPDDLSELHEVLPLTPTPTGETNRLPDIENMLRSDPPPPPYVDVATSSMRDKFRWRSRRKGTLTNEQKAAWDLQKVKRDEALSDGKRISSGAGRSRTRFSFQRSFSHQSSRTSRMRANSSMPAQMASSGEEQPKAARKPSILASFRLRSPRIPTSASESLVSVTGKTSTMPERARDAAEAGDAKAADKEALDTSGANVKFDLTEEADIIVVPDISSEQNADRTARSNKESYGDDDEVFM